MLKLRDELEAKGMNEVTCNLICFSFLPPPPGSVARFRICADLSNFQGIGDAWEVGEFSMDGGFWATL